MKSYKPLITICFGYFMVIIDVTVVNVAMPRLAIDLNVSLAFLGWVVDAYTLTFASLLLSVGSISDRLGTKRIFQSGLIVFIASSFSCGIAQNFQILIISRLAQGIGAALLVPTSISLINISYPDRSELSKAIGIWAGIAGIAAALGPVIGAFITAIFNWRGIFLINLPFGLLCLYLTNKWIITSKIKIQSKLDFWGQVFGIILTASLTYGLINLTNIRKLIMASIIFFLSFLIFIFHEYFNHAPMLPLEIFKSRRFTTSIAIGFLLNLGFYGVLFLLPIYFHQVKLYSIFVSGLAITPLVFLVALGSYVSGKLMITIGDKMCMLTGLLIGSLGFGILLIGLKFDLSYSLLVFPLLLIGFGTSFTMPAATLVSITSVSVDRSGLASAVLNTSRQLGSLVGVALFGGIISISHTFNIGMQLTLLSAFCSFLLGFILVNYMIYPAQPL